MSRETTYGCGCNRSCLSKPLHKQPESVQSHLEITLTVEKLQKAWNTKGIKGKVRKGEGVGVGVRGWRRGRRRRGENKWHSTPRSTLATWLFQNESNARPKNEKKEREKNQYSAIKHKAWLCGAEGNLLFIKFTPPPASPPNPITLLSL